MGETPMVKRRTTRNVNDGVLLRRKGQHWVPHQVLCGAVKGDHPGAARSHGPGCMLMGRQDEMGEQSSGGKGEQER